MFKLISNDIPISCEWLHENDILPPGHQSDFGIIAKLAQRLPTSPKRKFGRKNFAIPFKNENNDRDRLPFFNQTDLLWFTFFAQREVVNLQPFHNLSIFAIQNLSPGDDEISVDSERGLLTILLLRIDRRARGKQGE